MSGTQTISSTQAQKILQETSTAGLSGVTQHPVSTGIGERIKALGNAGMNLSVQQTQRKVTQTSAKVQAAREQLTSAIEACDRTAKQSGISPEAKAVYRRLGNILKVITKDIGGDFSSQSIGVALSSALKVRSELSTLGGTGTVGIFDEEIDGSEYKVGIGQKRTDQGYPATKPEECYARCVATDLPSYSSSEKAIEAIKNSKSPRLQNVKPKEKIFEDLTTTKTTMSKNASFSYKIEGKDPYKADGSFTKRGTLTCPSGFPLDSYSSQLEREFNTFSGDVHIHKLEPGTVLVRVFGKGQSVKSSCWARLDDDKSSVTCAEDLYKKLAVMADWNGDGNLGVFVVPEDANIWVAEGKIASQFEKYTSTLASDKEQSQETESKGRTESKYFVYQGTGTQLNILTPNRRSFGGVEPEIFEKCMICFRNDGIMEPKDRKPSPQR